MVTLHEDQFTFLIISRSFRRVTRNVSVKTCRENPNTFYFRLRFSQIVPFMR